MNKIVVILLVLTLFTYGCSGSSSNNDSNTPSIGETITTVSILKEIGESVEKGLTGEYSVTYEMAFENEKTDTTIYMKDEKLRTDSMFQGIESRSYYIDDVSTVCTKEANKFKCYKSTSGEEVMNPAETKLEYTEYEDTKSDKPEEELDFKVYRDGTFSVSGHTGKCYVFEFTATSKERMCLSSEGVLLYHKFTDGNETSEFTAKSYTNKVSDNVFELPEGAEIIDMNEQIEAINTEYANQMAEADACYAECSNPDLNSDEADTCYNMCDTKYQSK